jgi:diadenylate cyclase
MTGSADTGDVTGLLTDAPLVTDHSQVGELVNRLVDVAESLSAEFGKWEEQYVSGPSLYLVIVADADYGQYADPLGTNAWPVDICRVVTDDLESFVTAAREVAFSCDGAVVVTVDGTVQEQMVRIRSPSAGEIERREGIDYAGWMGTKHLSAVEISTREEVLTAVTLSEENGRVTVFRDGGFEDRQRDELGGRWRVTR